MFRFVSIFAIILACTQLTLGSNLHGALYSPSASLISGRYGQGVLANSVISRNLVVPTTSIISSHSRAIVHPDSGILRTTIGNSIPNIGQQQYISAPLTHQIYSSPLVSTGHYGQSGLYANSYGVQSSYTAPLVASGYSGHGLYSAPVVANSYGAQLDQAHGNLSGW